MDSFFDTPIPEDQVFSNAPKCRTRREATRHYLDHVHYTEPQPDVPGEILHHIVHPFSMGSITDRQITLQDNGNICKSTRIGRSNLGAEKHHLELVAMKTSVPVPRVHQYYVSEEFEHLVMENMPGTTLEQAWPTLSHLERKSIADQVVSLVQRLRELRSTDINAALLFRRPLHTGLRDATDLSMERIKPYLSDEHIVAYINKRSAIMEGQLNVFTHGDLDWGNILIADKQVCGLIDLESSGFFPPYWEWMMVKRLSHSLPKDSWFHLLEERLRAEDHSNWQAMWEVEQLIMALDEFSRWDLTPAGREMNRHRGWTEVVRILGPGVGDPPVVLYEMAAEHPWWLVSAADGEVKFTSRREWPTLMKSKMAVQAYSIMLPCND
ncbi:kinase-like domain-containing protein [Fusarium oxysporum f. sp. albedinis]|nr:kinase-like domain-containing protein [Fusarium oxysporum f. sp. albedinis]